MIETIRSAVEEVLNHWQLTDYVPAVVDEVAPLCLKLREDLFLTEDNLIFAGAIGSLVIGDRLVLLRVLRGQKYLVLSKAVTL